MKVRIEIDDSVNEEEVIIRCRNMNETVLRIQSAVMEQNETGHSMLLKQGGKDYYLPVEEILFFETECKAVYAHTRENILETEYKLYELEELLPGFFMRISKSAIVNLNHIYSIARNLASSSVVEFAHSHKQVYVSRNYYKALVERLAEKRRKL